MARSIRYALYLLITLLCAQPGAHAQSPLDAIPRPVPPPWPTLIEDPFDTQKKIADYGVRLKPSTCPPPPDTSQPLTLNEVVIATICHSPDARIAYISLLSSKDGFDSTIMGFLPDITASASASKSRSEQDGVKSISRSSSASASTSMTLYDFGRRETSLAIADRTLVIAGLSYDSSLQGFIASALQAYFTQLTAQNALLIEQESIELSKATLDAAETRYDLGLISLSDVLQARTRYDQTRLSLTRAENSLALSTAQIAQSMGFAPATKLSVAELDDTNIRLAPFNQALAELMEQAKAKRVDLKSRVLQLDNARDSYDNSQRRTLPSISASASRSYSDWDVFNGTHKPTDSIGLSVSVPIFTGFGNVFSDRAQRKQIESQAIQLEDSVRDIEQDVLRSWQNYTTSRTSYDISVSSLRDSARLKDLSLARYREGLSSILDLLSAYDSYRNALQSHLTSRYGLLTTRVDLIRSVGELDLENIEPRDENLPELAEIVTFQDPLRDQGAAP